MENVSENEKRNLKQKFFEFQKWGLESYGKYLAEQLEYASKSDLRNAYKKYIEKEIEMNILKINEIDEKLK
jgi:hypothetical protein